MKLMSGRCVAAARLQVVVEIEPGSGLGHQPFVPGHWVAAVIDHEVGGVQLHPDLPADQANRHGVAVRADGDLAEPVDPRGQLGAGLERLIRQRCQLRLLDGEVLADGVRPGADAASVVSGIPLVDHGVELLERVHLRNLL